MRSGTYARHMGMIEIEQASVLLGAATVLLAGSVLVLLAASTVRRGRRRYHAFRASLSSLRTGCRPGRWNPGSVIAVATATVGSPGWWMVQRRRHQMWRAVTAAEHAVKVAEHAGVPVGDLPLLARRLRTATRGVDAQMRASAVAGALPKNVTDEPSRIQTAAVEVHRAALDAMRVMTGAEAEPLVSAIRVEVAALAAGVRAASSRAHLPVG